MIYNADKKDYPQLIAVWEASVRATHDFLSDEEIVRLKKLVLNKYFDSVELKCCKNAQDEIVGFCGLANKKIEMLFVASHAQGQGVGSRLCQYAIEHGAIKVDVNEQNPRAIDFYKKMGFKIVGRSELDGEGRPYPLLHMEL
jgi:putative acetyltransferase